MTDDRFLQLAAVIGSGRGWTLQQDYSNRRFDNDFNQQ